MASIGHAITYPATKLLAFFFMSVIIAPSLGMLLQVVPCSINIDMDQISNPEMLLHSSDASNEKPEEILLEDKPEATIPEMLRPSSDTPDESPASLVVDAAACAQPMNTLKKSMCMEGSDDDDENPNDISMDDVPENNDAANQNSPFRMSSGLLPFPDKLMSLLDSNKVSEAMRWLRDGDAFCIAPGLFTERVLDKYFQGTKFESFTRKLNRWGFKRVAGQKVPPNMIAYYHKDFLRGAPKLLKNMNGGKKKMVSARERQLRAQQKQDLEREATSFALSTQHRTGVFDSSSGRLGSAAAHASGTLGGIRALDQFRLELLASNSMAIEQELNRRKFEQQQLMNLGYSQFLDTKQASMSLLPQQRDELQIQALLAQQRARQETASTNWLTVGQRGMQPSMSSQLAALRYLELQRTMQDPSLSRTAGMGSSGQFLLAQQTPSEGGILSSDNAQPSILQRLIAEKIGVDGHLNARTDAAASKVVPQELLNDQRNTKLTSEAMSSQSTGAAPGDKQLLELYSQLHAQHDGTATRIVQHQLLNDQQLTKLSSEAMPSQSSVGSSLASGDTQLLELYLRQQQESENAKRAP